MTAVRDGTRMDSVDATPALARFQWQRHPQNPILPTRPDSAFDSVRCMNPFAVRCGSELRLYYAGAAPDGKHRLCVAISQTGSFENFEERRIVLDTGAPGAFDELWCVLPLVHKIGKRWHLYYSGRENSSKGLQSFPGTGLAISEDGLHFERYSTKPIITGDQLAEYTANRGIACGGSILEFPQPDGSILYRMYYTVALGVAHPDPRVNQEKLCAVCHSRDGIHWFDHRIVLRRRPDCPTDDYGVAAPFVWRDGNLYRMLYSAIGSRWGFYSLCEAVSRDGYEWSRGSGDNVSLAPSEEGRWDSQMCEYAFIERTETGLRLFYCGNNYGGTGIGVAECRIAPAF